MKAVFLLTVLIFSLVLAPITSFSQSRTQDDIYTNKNPRDYYDDKDDKYVEEYNEEEDYKLRRKEYDDEPYDEQDVYSHRDDENNYRRNENDYVCRPRHHYNCRHDRRDRRYRSYWFPGGHVIISPGKHGYVRTKVWVPGHWEYSPGGHRFWVPGRYKYERVRW